MMNLGNDRPKDVDSVIEAAIEAYADESAPALEPGFYGRVRERLALEASVVSPATDGLLTLPRAGRLLVPVALAASIALGYIIGSGSTIGSDSPTSEHQETVQALSESYGFEFTQLGSDLLNKEDGS